MPRMAAPGPVDDGWIAWRRISQTRIACCDCGLVHDTEVMLHKGSIWIRMRRNARSTAQVRRHMVSPSTPRVSGSKRT